MLGIEKRGHVDRLKDWFEQRGLPVLPLGGNASQTLVDDTKRYIWSRTIAVDESLRESDPDLYENATMLGETRFRRDAVLIYAGDLDPSGEDIERDFVKRVGLFEEVRRVALKIEHLYDADYLMFAGNPQGHHAKEFAEKYRNMLPGLAPDHPVTEKIAELDGLFQVEINAMDNDLLRSLFEEALKEFWSGEAYAAAMAHEDEERDKL